MRRGFALPIILLLIVALISIIAGWYFLYGREWFLDRQLRRAFSQNDGLYNPLNPPLQSPKDETANWKTYTNEKFRYSIQYPQNLKLIVNNNRPSITNNNNDTKHYFNISIEASDNTKNQTAQDFVSSSKILTASGEYKNPFITPKPYTKGSLNGVISDVTNGDDFYLEVIQANDGKIYEFKLLSGPDTGTKPTTEDRTTFDQILSTFKFLD